MYVLQKVLLVSMPPTLGDTAILPSDGFSLSLKFQWAVLVIAIDKALIAQPSRRAFWCPFLPFSCLRSVVIEARATFSAGKGAVELDAICQPGD